MKNETITLKETSSSDLLISDKKYHNNRKGKRLKARDKKKNDKELSKHVDKLLKSVS